MQSTENHSTDLAAAQSLGMPVTEYQALKQAFDKPPEQQSKTARNVNKREQDWLAEGEAIKEEKRQSAAIDQEHQSQMRAIEQTRAEIELAKQSEAELPAALAGIDSSLENWTSPLTPVSPRQWLETLLQARVVVERKAEFLPRWRAQRESQLAALEQALADFRKKHGIKFPG